MQKNVSFNQTTGVDGKNTLFLIVGKLERLSMISLPLFSWTFEGKRCSTWLSSDLTPKR
jgi:hypothetical protein